ncbi:hypothetical protein KAR48_10015 [bacterium]|nr:hypothetical protein [bacterium]
MEVKLDNLIEQLKKEGIEDARKAADIILAKAKAEAELILEKAGKAAETREKQAEEKAAQFNKNAELAVRQAGRDAELLLKEQINRLFDRVFKQEVGKGLDAEFLKGLILEIVTSWGKSQGVEVEINEDQAKDLEKVLFSGVETQLRKGITLHPSKDLSAGFRIGIKGENLYYDFSDESISELLRVFLNQRINDILAG